MSKEFDNALGFGLLFYIFIVVPTVPSSCFCFHSSFFFSSSSCSSSASCHDLCPCVFLCIEKCFVRVFVLMVYLARGEGRESLAAFKSALPCPVCVGNLSFADSTNKRFFYAQHHSLSLLSFPTPCWLFITIYCCLPQRIDKKQASKFNLNSTPSEASFSPRFPFRFQGDSSSSILIAYKVNIARKFIGK